VGKKLNAFIAKKPTEGQREVNKRRAGRMRAATRVTGRMGSK
jgi:hypothetical protein